MRIHGVRFRGLWAVGLVAGAPLALVAGCGKKEGEGAAAAAASAGGAAVAAPGPAAVEAPAAGAAVGSTVDQVLASRAACERKAEAECGSEPAQRKAFYERKRAAVATSPFKVTVHRAYVAGGCGKGPDPAKRSGGGLWGVVEGELTYTGTDLLADAVFGGAVVLRFGDRLAEIPVQDRTYSYFGGYRYVSKLLRPARGADPWLPGESREFHWESEAGSAVFCEAMPSAAEAYLSLATMGIRTPQTDFALGFVPLAWDEVVGMAVDQKVTLRKPGAKPESDEEGTVSFLRLDRALVTRSSGKLEWMPRGWLRHPTAPPKLPTATLPAEVKSEAYTVRVKSVKTAGDFGAWDPPGEDQSLTLVEVEVVSGAVAAEGEEPKPVKVKGFGFKLETAPGTWSAPLKQPLGAFDFGAELAPGATVTGTLAFPRQRFERPIRLEVRTPDKAVLLVPVHDYAIGPERAPK